MDWTVLLFISIVTSSTPATASRLPVMPCSWTCTLWRSKTWRSTHWKQTLFMLDRPVRILEGDSIAGTIVLRRNPVWRRHMTITLHWSINSSTGGTEKGQVGKNSFPMWR